MLTFDGLRSAIPVINFQLITAVKIKMIDAMPQTINPKPATIPFPEKKNVFELILL